VSWSWVFRASSFFGGFVVWTTAARPDAVDDGAAVVGGGVVVVGRPAVDAVAATVVDGVGAATVVDDAVVGMTNRVVDAVSSGANVTLLRASAVVWSWCCLASPPRDPGVSVRR
jgi:hypothetical protein